MEDSSCVCEWEQRKHWSGGDRLKDVTGAEERRVQSGVVMDVRVSLEPPLSCLGVPVGPCLVQVTNVYNCFGGSHIFPQLLSQLSLEHADE
jgi:hypothetical protein